MTTVATSAPISSGKFAIRPRTFTRKVIHFFLHSSPFNKAILIGAIVLAGSGLQLLNLVPDTFLSDKYNSVNLYMVKLSWLWTLLFLLVAVTLTAPLYCKLQLEMMVKHFARLGIGHLVWYCGTNLITTMDNSFGTCIHEHFTTYGTCSKAGHSWSGFNISGHMFLLTYCILVITEEANNIKVEILDEFPIRVGRAYAQLGAGDRWCLMGLYNVVRYLVQVAEIYGLFLVLAWMIMVTSTALYFHTFMEKAVGYFFGVGCWYVTYGLLYGTNKYVPCRPSAGALHPMYN